MSPPAFSGLAGRGLSDEIGVLFNPNDPANRLYPRQKTLDEVLDLLNDPASSQKKPNCERSGRRLVAGRDDRLGLPVFHAQGTAGSGPQGEPARNSYELAFRNQFFTPRYVVEFLTDNTLGRIWYEMRRATPSSRTSAGIWSVLRPRFC